MNRALPFFFILFLFYSCNPGRITTVCIGKARVRVELADTDQKRARGLMFRDSLKENEGMLFVFPVSRIPAFYMKNTSIPLDILFIDRTKRIVSISQMEPFDENTHHRPPKEVLYALEVEQGWAERNGVKPGQKVFFRTSRNIP